MTRPSIDSAAPSLASGRADNAERSRPHRRRPGRWSVAYGCRPAQPRAAPTAGISHRRQERRFVAGPCRLRHQRKELRFFGEHGAQALTAAGTQPRNQREPQPSRGEVIGRRDKCDSRLPRVERESRVIARLPLELFGSAFNLLAPNKLRRCDKARRLF